jgi:AraC-like DNA-binding protein
MLSVATERTERGTCCDIDDVARPLRRAGSDIHQLGHGPLHGEHDHVHLRNAWIHRVAVNRTVHAFNARPSRYGVVLVISASARNRFCGSNLTAGEIGINTPGDGWDFLLSGEWLRLEISDELLPGEACNTNARSDSAAGRQRVFRPQPDAFTYLVNQAKRLLNQASHDAKTSAAPTADRAEEELIATVQQTLQSAECHSPQHPRSTLSHRRVVLQAHQFMVNHIARPLTVDDVCGALDISERTLRYAFHDAFELSPMAYFKLMRLNAVHREFKAHDRSTITVHEVAERFGFEHVGAFAADYRKLFGVYPSETLAPVRRSSAHG